jgi:hypothetical protein
MPFKAREAESFKAWLKRTRVTDDDPVGDFIFDMRF